MAPILAVGRQLYFKTVTFTTLLVLLTSTAFAADRWLRLAGPGFEIWSDAGEARTKETLHAVQKIEHVLLAIQPDAAPSSRPVRLVVFRTEAEFRPFRPLGNEQAAGFFLPGRQYDYIVLSSEVVPGIESVVFHEYLHLFSSNRNLPVPHWFAEGMSELFSNAKITRTGIEIGDPIPAHVQKLRAAGAMDLTTLFTPANDPLFYPKSWALVRLLSLSTQYRVHLDRFLSLVSWGEPHSLAFQQAFDKTVVQVGADVRASLTGPGLAPWVMKTEAPAAVEEPRPVPESPDRIIADLLQELQRFDEARAILTRLAKEHEDAAIEAQLGNLAMRHGDAEQALGHYSKAIALGTTDAQVYFDRAMLRRDREGGRQQAIEDLREAVELNPDYAEAYQQLNALTLREQTAPARKSPGNGWKNRQGDRQVEGMLVELDCSSAPARFVLKTAEGELMLVVSDPAQVVIGSDPGVSAELNCGVMAPRGVAVEYKGASKEITAIEFK